MLYNFYGNYKINDANIGCGRVIVSECDGTHVYVDLCQAVLNCVNNLDFARLPDCVESFLNNLSSYPVGAFVRIAANGCLEAVPVTFPDTDYRVAVDSTDTPGYLVNKLVGCSNVTITPEGPAGNRRLRICFQNTGTFTGLTDVPDNIYDGCAAQEGNSAFQRAYIIVNQARNGLTTHCEMKYLGNLYLGEDVTINENNGIYQGNRSDKSGVHGYLGGLSLYEGDPGLTTVINVIDSASGASYNVSGGPYILGFRIPEDGIYRFWFRGVVRVNPGVQAFRIYITSGDPTGTPGRYVANRYHGIADCKFGAGDNPQTPMVFDYDKKLNVDSDTYFTYSGDSGTIWCTTGQVFTLGIAIDTKAGTNIPPRIKIFSAGLPVGTYNSASGTMGKRSGLGFHMEFVRKRNFSLSFT